jgi:putative transposase
MNRLPLVTYFKSLFPFFNDVDSYLLAASRRDFENALKNYFKSKKKQRKGKQVGFPQFKKKGVCKDSYRTNMSHGNIKIDYENKRLKLPKIGWVKTVFHRQLPTDAKITNVTVTRNKDFSYFVSIGFESELLEIERKLKNNKDKNKTNKR